VPTLLIPPTLEIVLQGLHDLHGASLRSTNPLSTFMKLYAAFKWLGSLLQSPEFSGLSLKRGNRQSQLSRPTYELRLGVASLSRSRTKP
jgi:hypothetical protein